MAAEGIDKDASGAGSLLQRCCRASQDSAESGRFATIELFDVRDVSPGFEVRKPRDFCVQTGRQPPEVVRPDLNTIEFRVTVLLTAKETVLFHTSAPLVAATSILFSLDVFFFGTGAPASRLETLLNVSGLSAANLG